eukprot:343825_1
MGNHETRFVFFVHELSKKSTTTTTYHEDQRGQVILNTSRGPPRQKKKKKKRRLTIALYPKETSNKWQNQNIKKKFKNKSIGSRSKKATRGYIKQIPDSMVRSWIRGKAVKSGKSAKDLNKLHADLRKVQFCSVSWYNHEYDMHPDDEYDMHPDDEYDMHPDDEYDMHPD